jgi:hypothetical protein
MTPTDELRAEVADKGRAVYDGQLKQLLEPDHNGEYVAIHVDSGDYALAPSWVTALQKIRERHEPGRLFGMKIGPEPDYGLAARLTGSRPRGSVQK